MNLPRPEPAQIRPLEHGDLTTLVQLCAEHAAFEQVRFDPAGKREGLERAVWGPTPHLFVWVATRSARPVGYASVSLEFSTWEAASYAHLDCLYLRPAARGQGLGTGLLETVIAFARAAGCRSVQWQTPGWNVEAQRFYAHSGAAARSKVRYTLPLEVS